MGRWPTLPARLGKRFGAVSEIDAQDRRCAPQLVRTSGAEAQKGGWERAYSHTPVPAVSASGALLVHLTVATRSPGSGGVWHVYSPDVGATTLLRSCASCWPARVSALGRRRRCALPAAPLHSGTRSGQTRVGRVRTMTGGRKPARNATDALPGGHHSRSRGLV